jgi:hypothetical protein
MSSPRDTPAVKGVALAVLALAILLAVFPRLIAYPLAALCGWISAALLYRAWKLRKQTDRSQSLL